MKIPIYQVDAFTKNVFGGNPAAICLLPHWLDDNTLLNIAKENNLAETAYLVQKEDMFEIRWFMPYAEIDLCGHATLASAYIIFNLIQPLLQEVTFSSKSGLLKAKRGSDKTITIDLPSRPPKKTPIPREVFDAFRTTPLEAFAARDLVLVFPSEQEIIDAAPQLEPLKDLPYLCTIITTKGTNVDFVSRVFDANGPNPEDPVTGSAHASLVPFWAERLQKTSLEAHQLSERGGILYCELVKDRVYLSGHCAHYLTGTITI